mmetsp:Transcript_94397/g.267141  ORF Transcript_94397/g.267141 Transcript_94397/m.267141 type:complete len:289 (-) Transcript_94397:61-927(-)
MPALGRHVHRRLAGRSVRVLAQVGPELGGLSLQELQHAAIAGGGRKVDELVLSQILQRLLEILPVQRRAAHGLVLQVRGGHGRQPPLQRVELGVAVRPVAKLANPHHHLEYTLLGGLEPISGDDRLLDWHAQVLLGLLPLRLGRVRLLEHPRLAERRVQPHLELRRAERGDQRVQQLEHRPRRQLRALVLLHPRGHQDVDVIAQLRDVVVRVTLHPELRADSGEEHRAPRRGLEAVLRQDALLDGPREPHELLLPVLVVELRALVLVVEERLEVRERVLAYQLLQHLL